MLLFQGQTVNYMAKKVTLSVYNYFKEQKVRAPISAICKATNFSRDTERNYSNQWKSRTFLPYTLEEKTKMKRFEFDSLITDQIGGIVHEYYWKNVPPIVKMMKDQFGEFVNENISQLRKTMRKTLHEHVVQVQKNWHEDSFWTQWFDYLSISLFTNDMKWYQAEKRPIVSGWNMD